MHHPLKLPYGVRRGEVERFVKGSRVVDEWLRKYPASTRHIYSYDLARYFKWLRMKRNINLTPRRFLNQHLELSGSKDIVERRLHLSLALEFCRDNPDFDGYSDSRKHQMFCAIRSWYNYHELTLTRMRGAFGRIRRKFKPKQITLAEAKRLMGSLSQRDRTILLIMLQSGMSVGDVLDHFNYMWPQIQPQLVHGYVKVEMPPRKNSDKPYFTYIGRDAVHELKKWLIVRGKITGKPMEEKDAVFVTKSGNPLTSPTFTFGLDVKLRSLGLKKGPFRLTSHLWRKLFKTEAAIPSRAVDRDMVEFMMGHTGNSLASVGGIYDRTPEIHEEVIEKEWRKLEPFLSIYSRPETAQAKTPKEQAVLESLVRILIKKPETNEKFLKFLEEL